MLLKLMAQEWDVGIWNVPMPLPDENHVLPWQPYREAQKNGLMNTMWESSLSQKHLLYTRAIAELFVDHMHPSPIGTQIMAKAVAEHIKSHPELLD